MKAASEVYSGKIWGYGHSENVLILERGSKYPAVNALDKPPLGASIDYLVLRDGPIPHVRILNPNNAPIQDVPGYLVALRQLRQSLSYLEQNIAQLPEEETILGMTVSKAAWKRDLEHLMTKMDILSSTRKGYARFLLSKMSESFTVIDELKPLFPPSYSKLSLSIKDVKHKIRSVRYVIWQQQ